MKKNGLLLALIISSLGLFSQKGMQFPAIKGVALDDKAVTVPAGNDKFSVIGIVFNRQAEDDLKKWLNPLYDAFIKKESEKTKEKGTMSFDMSDFNDVNFIFIPMIAGFRKVAEEFKKGTDKEFWPYIMDTDKTDIKELQKQLKVEDNKIPYFYVLNKEGKIVASEKGKYEENKMDRMQDAIE